MVEKLRSNVLVDEINNQLSEKHPNEAFLKDEIDGVYQGLVNSIRWAVVRIALDQLDSGGLFKVDTLDTANHFCTDLMVKQEIINRITDTSGLDYETSADALSIVERIVDFSLSKFGRVELEYIGTIEVAAEGQYKIELSNDLRIYPGEEKVHGRGAY